MYVSLYCRYSIFIVSGELPECTADDILRNNPVESCSSPRSHVLQTQSSSSETDPDIQAALRLSLQDSGQYDSQDSEERS